MTFRVAATTTNTSAPDTVPAQVVATVTSISVRPTFTAAVDTTVKTVGGRALDTLHADSVVVSPSDGSIATASVDPSTGIVTVNGVALGAATVTPKYGSLVGTPFAVACVNSLAGPNEPVGHIMMWQVDPSDPAGLSQQGLAVNEPVGVSIVDAAWSPNGKAIRMRLPASSRANITDIAPVTSGPHAGWTRITAPGFGLLYAADYYTYTPGGYPGTLTSFGVAGALGLAINGLQFWNIGGVVAGDQTVVVDDDTVIVALNSAGLPAYAGGGVLGFAGGIGSAAIAPVTDIFSSLYNTRLYVATLLRAHDDYPLNLGAGAKMHFGCCQTFFQSSIYGADWGGIAGSSAGGLAEEFTAPLGIIADWSQNGVPGGGGGGGLIGGGYTDGHPSFDFANTSRPDNLVRGVPMLFELLMVGDSEGDVNAEAHLWFNKTVAGSPDYSKTAFQFADGTYGFVGFGPRGFCIFTSDNTDGGGGMLPTVDKIVDFAYIVVSGGYARAGEQPDHWELSIDTPTGAVGRTVRATATLVDANGNVVRTCVNPSPFGNGGAFGSASDVQMDTDNGATWSVVPGSWSDTFHIVGEVLHASTVLDAVYATASGGPIGGVVVKFGGVAGNDDPMHPDYSIADNGVGVPAHIHILSSCLKTGAVTIDYASITEQYLHAGQIALDVVLNNPGDTNIRIKDTARALNGVRFGDWREGAAIAHAA